MAPAIIVNFKRMLLLLFPALVFLLPRLNQDPVSLITVYLHCKQFYHNANLYEK
jgi:hypothetical protein